MSRQRTPRGAPRCAAVVVDYEAGPPLNDCVASLEAQASELSGVVVVENGSLMALPSSLVSSVGGRGDPTDPSERHLDIEVISSRRNLGYGGGANRGIAALAERTGLEYLMVMNSDVCLHAGSIRALVDTLDSDPSLAIVGPRILNTDDTVYPSARRFPSMIDAAGHALIGLFRPDNRFSRRYRDGVGGGNRDTADSYREVDWVSGACFAARLAALEELGGFDEQFFMFAEDLDLCWRAHRDGWGVAFVPSAVITHLQGVSTRRQPYKMVLEHHRSTWRFARRSLSGWRCVTLPLVAVVLSVRLVVDLVKRSRV